MLAGVGEVDLLDARLSGDFALDGGGDVLLRVGGVPVGRVRLEAGRPPEAMAAIARGVTDGVAERVLHLAVLAWLDAGPPGTPFAVGAALERLRTAAALPADAARGAAEFPLSIAICTRDRDRQLQRAVAAIAPCLGTRDELLVVLNAPSAGSPSPVLPADPRIRVIREPRPGQGWARNRALAEGTHDVLAFTDDDCVPDAGWIPAIRQLFARNPDVEVATGLVEPLELATPAQRSFERYGGFPRDYRRRWIHAPRRAPIAAEVGNVGEFGAGANLVVRRSLAQRIGPFDPALGPGTGASAGDDLEFIFRALKGGALLATDPRSVVRHEHRRDDAALVAQIEGWSRGFACAVARSVRAFPDEGRAYRHLLRRIALLYHGRRALFGGDIRPLALAELRGMRGAAACYARARAEAERLARDIASPTADAPPRLLEATPARDVEPDAPPPTRSVELVTQREPLQLPRTRGDVSVAVTFHGRPIGTVALRPFAGAIGVDRLRDAVLQQHGGALVQGDWRAQVVGVRRAIVGDAMMPRERR